VAARKVKRRGEKEKTPEVLVTREKVGVFLIPARYKQGIEEPRGGAGSNFDARVLIGKRVDTKNWRIS